MHFRRAFVVLGLAIGVPCAALACIWDYDTLQQERGRFPSALELITGKFLRHSPEFYQWRIEDRLKKLKSDPQNAGYYDDLAVAYQKTGQSAKAIETMQEKERIAPRLYETYSNLGTFYILDGDFERGLPYIDKALAINPDAHFGREKYQKWLVEYAQSKMNDGKLTFPMYEEPYRESDFSNYLTKTHQHPRKMDAAVHAMLGMMRFANHENPLLLEALGDLMVDAYVMPENDAKQLAARAYLKASYVVTDSESKKRYREMAAAAISLQLDPSPGEQKELPFEALEQAFAAELADSARWYAELKSRELGWIKSGADVEAEFDKLYAEEPAVVDTEGRVPGDYRPTVSPLLVGVGALAALVVAALAARKIRRGRRPPAAH